MNAVDRMREVVSELASLEKEPQIQICLSKEYVVRYFGEAAWEGILDGTITDMGALAPHLNRKQFFQDVLK